MIELRDLSATDLPQIADWLARPHVARWWTEPIAEELAGYRAIPGGTDRARALMALEDQHPVGWCQWYRWVDEPSAVDLAAQPGEVGIDYAIGDSHRIGHGVGTRLIAALIRQVRSIWPSCGFRVPVDALNVASRRVLEKNRFVLVDERDLADEPEPLSAIYRLSASA